MAYYDELYKEFILNQLSGGGNIPALNEQSLIEAYTPRPFNLGFPQGNIGGVSPYTGKSYSYTKPTVPISGPVPYQKFDPPIQNLGITQQQRWSPGVQHSGMPVDEPTGLFGKSNLSGLIGDNKMAAALIALRGLEAGSKGQNIFQAAAPAAIGGLSDAFIIEKYKDIKKKTKAKEKIQKSKAFTKKEKLMVEAGMKLPTSSATAKMKDFSFFKNIDWNNPVEVAAANAIYTGESKTKWMSKISASLAKREDLSDDEIKEKLTFFDTIYDDVSGKTTTETTTVEGLAIPAKKSDLIDGQNYNVNGESLIWYEKENQFR